MLIDYHTLLDRIQSDHLDHHRIIVRAPGRLNIIGEHTDYNLGYCFPATINLYVLIGISLNDKIEISSLDQKNSWSEDQDFTPDWLAFFRGVLRYADQSGRKYQAFKVTFGATLPSGAGLSSSSAITCGFLFAMNELFQWNLSLQEMTKIAVNAERESGLEGGMMDQISIYHGHDGHALFIDCATWEYEKIPMSLPNYEWIIIDTKVKHKLVDSDYNLRSRTCRNVLEKFKTEYEDVKNLRDVYEKYKGINLETLNEEESRLWNYVIAENDRCIAMKNALKHRDVSQVGFLLYEGHEGLRKEYCVSCDELDFLVDSGRENGAIGVRMMGGGFGGSTIHLILEDKKEEYIKNIKDLYHARFKINPSIYEVKISDGVRRIE